MVSASAKPTLWGAHANPVPAMATPTSVTGAESVWIVSTARLVLTARSVLTGHTGMQPNNNVKVRAPYQVVAKGVGIFGCLRARLHGESLGNVKRSESSFK